MPVDADVSAFLEQLAAAEGPSMADVGPEAAREMYRAMQSMNPIADIASIEDHQAGDIPIRIYRNRHEVTPAIVYFHGGGWVIGSLDTHDCICTQLVDATDITVIAVDYRLAPEHPFPASVDDCFRALCWIADHADSLNIDPGRLAVAGDSAGGNLSAVISVLARDRRGPSLKLQLLLYPVTDSAMDTASYAENADGYLLTREGMTWFWDNYVGDNNSARTDPRAAPARSADLSGLPSACIVTAGYDPLRDEGEAYGKALNAAGVETSVRRFDGTIHGFIGMPFDSSKKGMAYIAEQIASALA